MLKELDTMLADRNPTYTACPVWHIDTQEPRIISTLLGTATIWE